MVAVNYGSVTRDARKNNRPFEKHRRATIGSRNERSRGLRRLVSEAPLPVCGQQPAQQPPSSLLRRQSRKGPLQCISMRPMLPTQRSAAPRQCQVLFHHRWPRLRLDKSKEITNLRIDGNSSLFSHERSFHRGSIFEERCLTDTFLTVGM